MRFCDLLEIAEREVTRTLRSLPPDIRRNVEEVPIIFEGIPRDPACDSDLLGLYDPGLEAAPAPRIILWLENLWDYAEGSEDTFREEVRKTLLHEIGHHLGWDEHDLDKRNL